MCRQWISHVRIIAMSTGAVTSNASCRTKILPAFRRLGFWRLGDIDDDTALRMTFGDCALQLDFAIFKIFGGDVAEDVGCHHAHRRATENFLGKRASAIAEDNA